MAYELIETVEVGSGGASSIEFTSIPQDGTDLVVKLSYRHGDSFFGLVVMQLAGDTGANYDSLRLQGDGSNAQSFSRSGATDMRVLYGNGPNSTANTFSNGSIYISNYTSTTNKSVSTDSVTENNGTTSYQLLLAGLHNTTLPTTSIKLFNSVSSFVEHSTASLYKITAA